MSLMIFFYPREAFFIIRVELSIPVTMEATNGSINFRDNLYLLLRAVSLVILPNRMPVLMAAPTSKMLLRRPLRIPSVKIFSVTGICGTLMAGAGSPLLVLLKKFLKLNPRSIVTNCPREVSGRPWTSLFKSNIHFVV